jgi:hypothetical protein
MIILTINSRFVDTASAKKAFQDFFELWKDADPSRNTRTELYGSASCEALAGIVDLDHLIETTVLPRQ